MGLVVLKFGGTSLRNISSKSEILSHIKKNVSEGNKVVVVVSAIGRKGEPYATDTLINQLENISPKIDPKKKDFIMSCGEVISAAIVSHLLESEGLPSEPLMGFQAGIITDDTFSSSKILEININRIIELLNKGKIVVVAGFQGITKEMEITTLGRGGSDTTAVALGGFLEADRVDIYTDVPGVAMIDPRMVPYAKYIKYISYVDMYKLSENGATVIHPRAVSIGMKYNIPIRVLSTFIIDNGTLISSIDTNEKVIGFGIKEYDDKNMVSLIYNSKFKAEVYEQIQKFIDINKSIVIQVIYSEDRVSFVVNSEQVVDFVHKLYDFFVY